uniref:Uncharacterized protein n=1 Tax=Strongyloides papillosus TaxID=174720 RepID=A0A0N5BWC3_STREA
MSKNLSLNKKIFLTRNTMIDFSFQNLYYFTIHVSSFWFLNTIILYLLHCTNRGKGSSQNSTNENDVQLKNINQMTSVKVLNAKDTYRTLKNKQYNEKKKNGVGEQKEL